MDQEVGCTQVRLGTLPLILLSQPLGLGLTKGIFDPLHLMRFMGGDVLVGDGVRVEHMHEQIVHRVAVLDEGVMVALGDAQTGVVSRGGVGGSQVAWIDGEGVVRQDTVLRSV